MTRWPTLEEVRSAPDSGTAKCCFCGDSVPYSDALMITVSREGIKSRQQLWAHLDHLEQAIRPARISIEPEELRTGMPRDE